MSEIKINRLVLVGNGFDLAHGLKTSFFDFINYCAFKIIEYIDKQYQNKSYIFADHATISKKIVFKKNKHSPYSINSINFQKFIELIKPQHNSSIPYIEKYKAICEQCIIEIEKEDISNSFIKLVSNSFFKIIVYNSTNQNWAGIEKDFYDALLTSSLIKPTSGYSSVKNIDNLNENFEEIINCLEEYLLYAQNTEININSNLLGYLKKDIFSHEVINNFSVKINRISMWDVFHDEFKFEPKSLGINKTLFLNFNYTNLVKEYIKQEQSNSYQLIHIHGELNNQHNPIIFGYGDEKDSSYQELENKNDNRYLQYLKSHHYFLNSNYKDLLNFIEQGKYQIYIWGHSCATSDRVLLETIFEHDNCISIIPFYHKKDNGSDNYTDLIMNISRSFTDKKKFRDVVVNKKYCEPL